MRQTGRSVDQIADKTKVPRSTLRAMLGETSTVLLPSRIYLRGHMRVIAQELGIDDKEAQQLFDQTFPQETAEEQPDEMPKKTAPVAIAAGLAGVGVLAVILSFFG